MFLVIQNFFAIAILTCFFLGRFLFSAIKGKRKKLKTTKEIVSGRFIISLLVYFIFPLLVIFGVLEYKITTNFSVLFFALGLLVAVIGLVLMLQARLYRQKDWGFMGDDVGEMLFTDGPYKITRHPYYIGAILVGVGVYLILNSWLIILMIPAAVFVSKVVKAEDKYLKEKFGMRWEEYRKKTSVIPWVK